MCSTYTLSRQSLGGVYMYSVRRCTHPLRTRARALRARRVRGALARGALRRPTGKRSPEVGAVYGVVDDSGSGSVSVMAILRQLSERGADNREIRIGPNSVNFLSTKVITLGNRAKPREKFRNRSASSFTFPCGKGRSARLEINQLLDLNLGKRNCSPPF